MCLRIRERLYRQGMKADLDVHNKIRHLSTTKTISHKSQAAYADRRHSSRAFRKKKSIDVVGSLRRSPSRNLNIVTIQENSSKHCFTIPMIDQRVVTVSIEIFNNFVVICALKFNLTHDHLLWWINIIHGKIIQNQSRYYFGLVTCVSRGLRELSLANP